VAAGLARQHGLAEALRLGVACGAANTLTAGAGVLRMEHVAWLREATTLTELG
jgi:fructose-1-phosphate kinase PfkB-like protein